MAGDPFVDLLDAARAEALQSTRSRERWLRQAAEESATLAGTLLDLAERGTPVTLRTTAGRATTVTVVAVGRDFCAVRTERGRQGCVALAALTRVRPAPGERATTPSGDRPAPLDLSLGELLAGVVADRPVLTVACTGDAETVVGDLRGVSLELLTLTPDGDPRGRCLVPLRAVSEVWFG